MRRPRSILVAVLALAVLAPRPAAAQEPTRPQARDRVTATEPAPADTTPDRARLPTPAGAMVRSFLVPGWGQASYDAFLRGGVFFAAQTGSWFMLIKTLAKLGEARDVEDRRIDVARDAVLAAVAADPTLSEQFAENPDSLARFVQAAVDEDPAVQDIRDLVESREQQREDWIAQVIFWTLASGVDAFVNAHLADFPGQLRATRAPDGRYSVGLHLPFPGAR